MPASQAGRHGFESRRPLCSAILSVATPPLPGRHAQIMAPPSFVPDTAAHRSQRPRCTSSRLPRRLRSRSLRRSPTPCPPSRPGRTAPSSCRSAASELPAGATGPHKSYFLTVGSSGLRWGCDVWAHKVLEGQVAGGMIRVQSVAPDSLGAELGLAPGTELLAVNGRPLEDFLDWEFLTADDRFVLAARMATGEQIEFDIERPEIGRAHV